MSRKLPSRTVALELLEQSGCSKEVIKHSTAVAKLAVEISKACIEKGLKVDVDLVEVGALLHDIGRCKTHTVDHALIGARIAERLELPNAIVQIIERHVGVGITESEAEKLGWPLKSYVPESIEERIVAYSDKIIHGKKRLPFEIAFRRICQDQAIPGHAVGRLKEWHNEFSSCQDEVTRS